MLLPMHSCQQRPFFPPIIDLLNFYDTACSIMPKNKLLQIKESLFVRNMLPKLHGSHPLVWIGLDSRTRFTHVFLPLRQIQIQGVSTPHKPIMLTTCYQCINKPKYPKCFILFFPKRKQKTLNQTQIHKRESNPYGKHLVQYSSYSLATNLDLGSRD